MKIIKHIAVIILLYCLPANMLAQSVYITKTGEKYHKSNCRYLKYSKKEIALEKAKRFGYEPCLVCKPTEKNITIKQSVKPSTAKSFSNTQTQKSIATQCTGKTKSGVRCKRKTKSTNGRCYQH